MSRSIGDQLDDIANRGLYRSTRCVDGEQGPQVTIDGRTCLMLCSNNYLGLASHPRLIEASCDAVRKYGASSGASRLVSGTMCLHEELEMAVAGFKGTESALVFNSGYSANTGIIGALVGKGDVVFSDRLNHASIIDGIILSGARLVRYPHNDISALENLLQRSGGGGRRLIVTDGVFSMDGDLARLDALVEIRDRHDVLLMVDDAHGSGVLGRSGRGIAGLFDCTDRIDILMGTFGKALGSFGAYAATNLKMRELLLNRSRSFIFSTSLPPAVLGASIAALEIVRSAEGDTLRNRLSSNTEYFREGLKSAGFEIGPSESQIIPVIVGDPGLTMEFSKALFDAGIFVQGIRPPTVPAGSSRLRITMMATHDKEHLISALDSIISVGRSLGLA